MVNLHNHTTFSDGEFLPEKIVEFAIKNEIMHLGICDHFKTKKIPKSMDVDKIDEYVLAINKIKERYDKEINIYLGLEIDFSLLRTNFVSLFSCNLEYFDYLLFEYVSDSEVFGLAIDELIKIRKTFPCTIGLAHCDIEKIFGKDRFLELIEKCEKNDIFVELNSSSFYQRGITPYYYFAEEFFAGLKNRNIGISIGSDTHYEIKEVGNISNAMKFIKQLGIEENLNFLIKKLKV